MDATRPSNLPNLRRQVLLEAATRPATLLPLVVGGTLLLVAWALGIKAGLLLFAGLAGVLFGAGSLCTRLLTGSRRIAQRVLDRWRAGEERRREAALDDLERRLKKDDDPRNDQYLRELRALAAAFRRGPAWSAGIDAQSQFDILADVDRLFASCVGYLEKTYDLWQVSERMEIPETRRAMLGQREKILAEVRQSIVHIGRVLARVQELDLAGREDANLEKIRDELDASLDVARKVQERIQLWDSPAADIKEPSVDAKQQ